MKQKTLYIDFWFIQAGVKNIVWFTGSPEPEQEPPVRIYNNVSEASARRLADCINNRHVTNITVARDGWTACISPPQGAQDA